MAFGGDFFAEVKMSYLSHADRPRILVSFHLHKHIYSYSSSVTVANVCFQIPTEQQIIALPSQHASSSLKSRPISEVCLFISPSYSQTKPTIRDEDDKKIIPCYLFSQGVVEYYRCLSCETKKKIHICVGFSGLRVASFAYETLEMASTGSSVKEDLTDTLRVALWLSKALRSRPFSEYIVCVFLCALFKIFHLLRQSSAGPQRSALFATGLFAVSIHDVISYLQAIWIAISR